MKRTKKFLVGFLASLSVLCGSLGLAACDETYTTTETDTLISELKATIEADKTELDGKITALTEAYQAKDSELLEKIEAGEQSLAELKSVYEAKVTELAQADEANKKAINDLTAEYTAKVEELAGADSENATALAELKTAYEAKVAELAQADEANKKAIDDLTAEYTAKVGELEIAISQANATIASNKAELNGAISALTANYEAKMTEIDKWIDTLQNTDATQNEKIAELIGKITALEEATRITGIAFAENGDLLVTFADGSTQTVKAPEQHAHTFGEWTVFTADDVPCENRLFFRVCADCNAIEWKQGTYAEHDWNVITTAPTCQAQGFDTKTCEICGKVETVNPTPIVDHAWATEYTYDNSYHWYDCATCEERKEEQEHSVEASGECSVCKELVGATGGIVYEVLSDGTAKVIMYEGAATRVRIADTYQGAPVTKIGSEAFKSSAITSIVISDSVISIGDSVFNGCSSLTSITIGNGVTSIGDRAFYDCDSLTSIYIKDIEAWCNISFGSSSANPLCYAKNLYLNSELVTELEIPNTITEIKDYAFYNCKGLRSIEIPDSVISIGNHAFVFCSSLTSITIGGNVTSIGYQAFYACSGLTSVTIGDSVTSIGENVFRGCSNLTSIVIPDSVTSIASSAFSACAGLRKVYYKGTAEDWAEISIDSGNGSLTKATRYYYSETQPTTTGNYWYYNENGEIAVW